MAGEFIDGAILCNSEAIEGLVDASNSLHGGLQL